MYVTQLIQQHLPHITDDPEKLDFVNQTVCDIVPIVPSILENNLWICMYFLV
jgi:hypothetical protein